MILLSSFIIAAGVSARETPADTILYYLPEIVVTAERKLVPLPKIGRTADENDFHARNAHNVAEALSQSSGINIQRSSSGGARVLVRGFRHRDVLILFDGIPIASAYEGALDLNEVTITNVAKVKMIKDAPSVLYGTNAMGGVVDIIPKADTKDGSLFGTLEMGEHSNYAFRGSLGRNSKYYTLFVSANHEASDGYFLSERFTPGEIENGGIRHNSDYTRSNYFLHLNSGIDPIGTSSIFLNYSDNRRGVPPQIGVTDPDYERLTDSKRLTLGMSNNFSFIPASLKLFYNRYNSELVTYEDSTYTKIGELEASRDYTYGATLYSRIATCRNNLLIFNLSFESDTYANNSDPEYVFEAETRSYSLAAENNVAIKNRLSITIGGLYSLFEKTRTHTNTSVLSGQTLACYKVNHKLTINVSTSRRPRITSWDLTSSIPRRFTPN